MPVRPTAPHLARDLLAVLLVKTVLLLLIKAVWFAGPGIPSEARERISAQLLGITTVESKSLAAKE